ncbi:response regulator with CheY-like receiver domain and winged-helix DNA-binding domain [Burkholderiales bacterium JOSHI_001]|nr:response regulator with CheY-like receiver domain and winged-helix DNA-binding domain [Burkholderiales bacterium JOSHI_001]
MTQQPIPIQRIVLVDDSEPDNVFHEAVLRRAGFDGDLQVFEHAEQALRYLRELPDGPVCLVLLDINMPGMDGWEFAQAAGPILQSKPTVVLVMLTSSSSEEDRRHAREIGCIHGFLTKPLTKQLAQDLLSGQPVPPA